MNELTLLPAAPIAVTLLQEAAVVDAIADKTRCTLLRLLVDARPAP